MTTIAKGFKKASKAKAKLRLALIGPSGSGKSYTALRFAKGLGGTIAVIDTERGSASLYAGDVADFDVCELKRFAPDDYIRAMKDAAAGGYGVLIIDSLSHAWVGEGGILDQKDAKGGRFDAWKELTPQHRDLIDAILGWPGHVIATMRVKTEYVVEKETRNGKEVNVPRKVGLAPVQRDGMEYEFTLVADLDGENTMHVSKSRCPALSGVTVRKPGEEQAKILLDWLDDGVDAPTAPPPPALAPAVKPALSLAGFSPAKETYAYAALLDAALTDEQFKAVVEAWKPKRQQLVDVKSNWVSIAASYQAFRWATMKGLPWTPKSEDEQKAVDAVLAARLAAPPLKPTGPALAAAPASAPAPAPTGKVEMDDMPDDSGGGLLDDDLPF